MGLGAPTRTAQTDAVYELQATLLRVENARLRAAQQSASEARAGSLMQSTAATDAGELAVSDAMFHCVAAFANIPLPPEATRRSSLAAFQWVTSAMFAVVDELK